MLTATTQIPAAATLPTRPQVADTNSPLDLVGAPIKYGRNNEIYSEDEPAEFVYRVVSGVVRVSKLLADGRRQVSAFCLPGDMFGLEAGDTHAFSAESIADSVVQVFKLSSLSRMAERDSSIARELWRATARDLGRAQAHMLLLGRKTALERIVAFLLDMASRAMTGHLVRLPMSRYDIADYLGLTIETVSRTLSQLEHQDVIELLSARKIILKNPPLLARLAG
jgi:CRP/FNR family nitrogen fixation transcriptional regulator